METLPPDRESLIPAEQHKIFPEIDLYPVKSETDEYEDPVALPYPVNTAGAEDSAFIMPDGKTLYVWFTPDVNNPVDRQVLDGVTGIYVFNQVDGHWSFPERVILQDPGKASLEGCEFVLNNKMWFCAAREGYTGLHWFTAELIDGKWQNWQLADFKSDEVKKSEPFEENYIRGKYGAVPFLGFFENLNNILSQYENEK